MAIIYKLYKRRNESICKVEDINVQRNGFQDMENVTKLKTRRSGNGGRWFAIVPGHFAVNMKEIHQLIKEGEVNFIDSKEPHSEYLACLKVQEPRCGDTSSLNRVIRNGGFVSYIERLERNIK